MPNLDGRGPRWGGGPGAGLGMGPCGGYGGYGWRFGGGYGRGFGFRRLTRSQELELLKDEEKALEEELASIREEIKELANK